MYKTNLYFLGSVSCFFNLLIHRVSPKHLKEHADIIICGQSFYDLVIKFKNLSLFDNVYIYNRGEFIRGKNETESAVINYFDEFYKKNNIHIDKYQNIFSFCDNWIGEMNLYYILKGIKYNFVQENPRFINFDGEKLPPTEIELTKKYKSLSPFSGKYCTPVLLKDTINFYKRDLIKRCFKFKLWDMQKDFDSIEKETLDLLFDAFGLTNLNIKKTDVLLIKNSINYTYKITTDFKNESEQQKNELFETIVGYPKLENNEETAACVDLTALDYYGKDAKTVTIKHHPASSISPSLLNAYYDFDFDVLPNNIYFQLLYKKMLLEHLSYKKIIMYQSTSSDLINLNSISKNILKLGNNFLRTWYFYDSLYCSILISEFLKFNTLASSFANKNQIELLSKKHDYAVNVEEINSKTFSLLENAVIVLDCRKDTIDLNVISSLKKSSIVIFLNIDFAEPFFRKKMINKFIAINVSKEQTKYNHYLNIRDEKVWVFSNNIDLLMKLKTFKKQLIFPFRKIKINVFAMPTYECAMLYNLISDNVELRNKCSHLKKTYKTIEKKINILCFDRLLNSNNVNEIKSILQNENNIDIYLKYLDIIKGRFLILASTKDTPGGKMPKQTVEKIRGLGFSKFSTELWRMYIGIIYNKSVTVDYLSDKPNEHIEIKKDISGINVEIKSKPLNDGNDSSIMINNKEYSAKLRGINIVVYDPKTNTILDSIGYDNHLENQNFVHLKI